MLIFHVMYFKKLIRSCWSLCHLRENHQRNRVQRPVLMEVQVQTHARNHTRKKIQMEINNLLPQKDKDHQPGHCINLQVIKRNMAVVMRTSIVTKGQVKGIKRMIITNLYIHIIIPDILIMTDIIHHGETAVIMNHHVPIPVRIKVMYRLDGRKRGIIEVITIGMKAMKNIIVEIDLLTKGTDLLVEKTEETEEDHHPLPHINLMIGSLIFHDLITYMQGPEGSPVIL